MLTKSLSKIKFQRTVLFWLTLFTNHSLFADSTFVESRPLEFYYNITHAISKASGNPFATSVRNEPNIIGLKYQLKKTDLYARGGLNFSIINRAIFDQFQRDINENQISLNLGIEFRRKINKRFDYYFGIDARYYQNNSETTTFFGTSKQVLADKTNGPGLAPLYGFRWNLHPRLTLYTEGLIGFEFLNTVRREIVSNTTYENSQRLSLSVTTPGSIFLIIKL
jgi:hypothetical protein